MFVFAPMPNNIVCFCVKRWVSCYLGLTNTCSQRTCEFSVRLCHNQYDTKRLIHFVLPSHEYTSTPINPPPPKECAVDLAVIVSQIQNNFIANPMAFARIQIMASSDERPEIESVGNCHTHAQYARRAHMRPALSAPY